MSDYRLYAIRVFTLKWEESVRFHRDVGLQLDDIQAVHRRWSARGPPLGGTPVTDGPLPQGRSEG